MNNLNYLQMREETVEVKVDGGRQAEEKEGGYKVDEKGKVERDESHSMFSHQSVDMHIDDILNLPLKDLERLMDTYPAKLEMAMVHRRANIFGVMEGQFQSRDPDTSDYYIHNGLPELTVPPSSNQQQICGCCFKQDGLRELSLNCNLKELSVFGSGYTMFFKMLTFCIYILTVQFFTSGLFNLVSNIVGNECLTNDQVRHIQNKNMTVEQINDFIASKGLCQYSFFTMLTQGNKVQHHLLNLCNEVLLMFSVVVIIFLLHFLRNELTVLEYQIDDDYLTPADYSLLVSNIHPDHVDDLRTLIEEKAIPGRKVEVVEIVFTFDYKNQLKLLQEKEKLYKDFFQKHKGTFETGWLQVKQAKKVLDQEVAAINNKIQDGQQDFFNVAKNKNIFSGKAIVSLRHEMDKEAILYYHNRRKEWRNRLSRMMRRCCSSGQEQAVDPLLLGGKPLRVEQASEPTDVFWQNLKYTDGQLLTRRVVSEIANMCSVGVSVGILFGLYFIQKQLKSGNISLSDEKYNDYLVRSASILIALCITVINQVMAMIMKKLSSYEKRPTRTESDVSHAVKLCWVLFINSALITLGVSLYYDQGYFMKGGIIINMSYLFITNLCIGLAFQILPVNYVFYLLRDRALRKGNSRYSMNQEMANIQLQKMEFNISFYYASICKAVFFTCFYSSIIPGGLLVTLIGLVALYWLYKYNLLRRCSYRYELGSHLAFAMLSQLEYSVILYCGSQLLWQVVLGNKPGVFTIIGLTAGVLNSLIPSKVLNSMMFNSEHMGITEEDYHEARHSFSCDYYLGNQFTRKQAFINMKEGKIMNRSFTLLQNQKAP